MRAVDIDSCIFQRSHEGSLFQALEGARAIKSTSGAPRIYDWPYIFLIWILTCLVFFIGGVYFHAWMLRELSLEFHILILLEGVSTIATLLFIWTTVNEGRVDRQTILNEGREDREFQREANKPVLHLVGGMHTIGSTIPGWLYLRCSSGVAKELNIDYICEGITTNKFCLSLSDGEMIELDREFKNKYEKESKINANITYKYGSTEMKETLSLDLAKIKSGEIELSYVSAASPLKDSLEGINRQLGDIARNIEKLART